MLRLIGCLISSIWLLMAISVMAQNPPVLDVDGQPLERGVEYYVLPAATDIAGGLTVVEYNGSCPLYAGQEPLTTNVSQGLPVVFRPRTGGETIIRESMDFNVNFFYSTISLCIGWNPWSVAEEDPETGRRLIVTRGEPDYFNIVKNELNLYYLRWCPNCLTPNCPRPRCGDAGILVKNGTRLLALDGPEFPFVFRRGLPVD